MSKPKIAIIILLFCYGGVCCINRKPKKPKLQKQLMTFS